METIKSYTSLEQSKKLAEILPIESADMFYNEEPSEDYLKDIVDTQYPMVIRGGQKHFLEEYGLPCWSLAALLEQLPYELCDDDGNSCYLQINKEDDMYQLVYEDPYGDFESIETDRYEHFVDTCYEMILKLHDNKLL